MANNKQSAQPFAQNTTTAAVAINSSALLYSGVLLVSHQVNAAGSVIYVGYSNTVTDSSNLAHMGTPLGPGQGIDVPLCNLANDMPSDVFIIGSAGNLILSVTPH